MPLNLNDYIFTSESVSEGHPDKVCDQISDSLLDLFLQHNPEARVAVETLAAPNRVILAGELRGTEDISPLQMEERVRQTIKDIGYNQEGFNWETVTIENLLHRQSADIAQGVDSTLNKAEGAGDQGIMFGFATKETASFMPAPIAYAHRILQLMAQDRKNGKAPFFGPDAKSQVSLRYENGVPVGAHSVLVSTQHDAAFSTEEIREKVRPYVLQALPEGWTCPEEAFYVNPTGRFVIGGPVGDAGLTGRKIIVDTYGGAAPHGGGAFSGKDPTKVDRSAAYAARYLAKNIVAAGLADRCLIQLSYAIGLAHPLSIYVNTQGTGTVSEKLLAQKIPTLLDLTPQGIRTHLTLNQPIYLPSASYGHFGRTPTDKGEFSWERLDLVDALKTAF